MVHAPAKFQENASMRIRVTVRKLNVMDGQTDGLTDRWMDRQTDGQAFGAAGDKNGKTCHGQTSGSIQYVLTQLYLRRYQDRGTRKKQAKAKINNYVMLC